MSAKAPVGLIAGFSFLMGASDPGDALDGETLILFQEVARARPYACELRHSGPCLAKRANAKLESEPVAFSGECPAEAQRQEEEIDLARL